MKPTDFSVHLTNFLTHYLAAQRNLSPNTIKAYRDVFTLLLRFCRDGRGIALERLSLAHIDAPLVEVFLDHLGKDRHASIRTQNHRLAALHAFFRYVQSEVPERMLQCQQILAIPLQRHARTNVGYLSKENLAQILAQPDLRSREGRRDAVLLSVLYDTGARVQELVDLSVGDVRLESPAQVRLMGKGRKMRAVPLMDATVQLLRDHLRENGLDRPERSDRPLFQNRQGGRFSRSGVRYVLQHYVEAVRCDHPGFTQPVSPHSLRHYLPFLTMSSDFDQPWRSRGNSGSRNRSDRSITRHSFGCATGYSGSREAGRPAYSVLACRVAGMSSPVPSPSSQALRRGRSAWFPPIRVPATAL